MSARDNVLKKLDETQLSGLLAAKKITPAEYQKLSTADDGTADLLAAVESLPKAKKAKPTKAAKPKLKKGRPCCEIEEVAAYNGARMFILYFLDENGNKQQIIKLGAVKLAGIGHAAVSGMMQEAGIEVPGYDEMLQKWSR